MVKAEIKIEEKKAEIRRLIIEGGYIYKPYLEKERERLRLRKRDKWANISLKDVPRNRWKELENYALDVIKEIRSKKASEEEHYSEGIKALEEVQAEVLRSLSETIAWFNEALYEAGFYATMIALQSAKASPENVEKLVEEFKDPKKFADYVKNHLSALYKASADVERIFKLEEQLRDIKNERDLLKKELEDAKKENKELKISLSSAMRLVCPDCAQRAHWIPALQDLEFSDLARVSMMTSTIQRLNEDPMRRTLREIIEAKAAIEFVNRVFEEDGSNLAERVNRLEALLAYALKTIEKLCEHLVKIAGEKSEESRSKQHFQLPKELEELIRGNEEIERFRAMRPSDERALREAIERVLRLIQQNR